MQRFREMLLRLAAAGWSELFDRFGINPSSDDLRTQLLTPTSMSPSEISAMPGFGDVSPDARRPIEPGSPARSLLFHALASPGVVLSPTGVAFAEFPTPADLEDAENLVFGIVPPSVQSLATSIGAPANLAIVVFAREYRQATKTVHGRHADMVFCRTGVCRVGTNDAKWDGRARAFVPRQDSDDPFGFRVLPCRYAAYIAVQAKGDASDFGPFKFNRGFEIGQGSVDQPDSEFDFWAPVHKLFSGGDCLLDKELDVTLLASHVNEKLRRLHDGNMDRPQLPGGFESGFKPPETAAAPFLVVNDLAEFLPSDDVGPGILAAKVRPRLVEPTELNGRLVGTKVPADPNNGLAPSFNFAARGRAHPAPEWMHVRSRLRSDGSIDDLNTREDVADIVRSARVGNTVGYTAAHYSDFTGDGWIDARIGGLGGELTRMVPAYSLIAAPDFYPLVDQSVLVDWWRDQVPTALRENIWAVPPLTLADQRSPANIKLRELGADIRSENRTPTAMVGLKGSVGLARSLGVETEVLRVSSLTDAAAGIFAPGWDVSTDVSADPAQGGNVLHLAGYGLGSPFPEDAKLCAALSAFWPGVAPDTARSAGRRVVAPMTDREVGLDGAPPWDGIAGPRRIAIGSRDFVETDNFDHVDYVATALANRFTMSETMKVDQETYQARVLATARMYRFIGDLAQQGDDLSRVFQAFRMVSFRQGRPGNPILQSAEADLGDIFDDGASGFEMAQIDAIAPLARDANNPARWLRRERIALTLFAVVGEGATIAFKFDDGPWQASDPLVS